MDYLKGTIIGLTFGVMAGAVIGASNCEMIHKVMKQGKKEYKRFKKKMNMA
ncbi:MAG: hypothetical protein IKV94_03585 [Clostridia bacterium]|nr:hypothetical protein [Clostridia bacterium]